MAATNDCILAASPAYNISGTEEGAKTVQSFAVPNNVHKLRFELVGGAGGTNNRMTPAGSGAKVSGIIPVTPAPPCTDHRRGRRYRRRLLTPTAGGEGYGNGGSVPAYTIPANVTAQVDAKYSNSANSKSQVYAASGGGSSALLIDGVVVAVAGGGGGAGMTTSGVSYADPGTPTSTARLTPAWRPSARTHPRSSTRRVAPPLRQAPRVRAATKFTMLNAPGPDLQLRLRRRSGRWRCRRRGGHPAG